MPRPNINWAAAQAYYIKHYNSNPAYGEDREPDYTFFADMVIMLNYKDDTPALLKEVQSYEKKMLKSYGKKPKAYCIMIDSVNLLSWFCASVGYHNLGRWAAEEYEDLFYNEDTWSKYVTEDQMDDIRAELN